MKGVNTNEDVEIFQKVIGKFNNWQHENNMCFNSSKFQLLRIGNNLPLIQSTNLYIDSAANPLEPVHEVQDLGVIVDSSANFKAQRISATGKAQKKGLLGVEDFQHQKSRNHVHPVEVSCTTESRLL